MSVSHVKATCSYRNTECTVNYRTSFYPLWHFCLYKYLSVPNVSLYGYKSVVFLKVNFSDIIVFRLGALSIPLATQRDGSRCEVILGYLNTSQSISSVTVIVF